MTTLERNDLLQHALVGFQVQKERIEAQMADVRRLLNGAAPPAPVEEKPKRRLSAQGRANIVRAAKERWRKARAAGRKRLK